MKRLWIGDDLLFVPLGEIAKDFAGRDLGAPNCRLSPFLVDAEKHGTRTHAIISKLLSYL